MSETFTIPDNPTPLELNQSLSICANNIARLADLCAEYKSTVAFKTTAYKRAYARALVKYSGEKNATIVKAKAEIDPDVMTAQTDLDMANAVYVVSQAEMDGYEAIFIALRKIVEMRKTEIRGGVGSWN